MKKPIATTFLVTFPLFVKTARLKAYGCIAIVLLAGCTSTQVRWDADNMREQVMVYYNNQIMENLIRAKYHLPFVHVDINLLTSQGASQISGTIGAGETRTHTDSGPIAALNMLSKAVTRPFAYSVTPQQTETLTISAVPALGAQALASPTPTPTESPKPKPTPTPTPTLEPTKETETTETIADGKKTSIATERTLKPAPTPKPITIYELYQDFADRYVKDSLIRPSNDEYVPGTLKKWRGQYYYVPVLKDKKQDNQLAYYNFCKALFTKGQATSLEKALLQTQAAAAAQ